MPLIDFQGTDALRIIDGRVLETAHCLAFHILEIPELHIDLKVMAGHLLLISVNERSAVAGVLR